MICIIILHYTYFLHSQVLQKPTPEQKQQLAVYSKHVAACVQELVQTAEAMKGEATHPADAHCHRFLFSVYKQKLRLEVIFLLPGTRF